jgi:hypothetical protein
MLGINFQSGWTVRKVASKSQGTKNEGGKKFYFLTFVICVSTLSGSRFMSK